MKNSEKVNSLRHSGAHLVAHALFELYPKTKFTIGPATQEGFFCDFSPEHNLKEEDLPKVAEKMTEIANRGVPIEHKQITKAEARKLYKDNPFKLELIDGIEGDMVGLSMQGNYYDLCRGGHVANTNELKHFKLMNLSGSYWRGDKNKPALQRISGVIFFTDKELRVFEKQREEALKYDHRKVGKELDLFSFHEEGPGFPFYHPHGKLVINLLTNFLRQQLEKGGYVEVSTPILLSSELWKQSGHYAHYKQNMYFSHFDDREYALKPMNCPGAILIYRERPRSYRDLPLRLAEFGHVHRYELSGVLQGLFRVRSFTIDDGHIFCTPDQMADEVLRAINITNDVLKKFGFEKISVAVSTKPENAMGDDKLWEKATKALTSGLEKAGMSYEILEGEGAFYGPKIEFRIEDSLGREWQCGTVQVDFCQPENFDLTYITNEGTKGRPVIIHRAIYGSLERFFAILLEHYKGKLPFWLAPMQIALLTITDEQKPYAEKIMHELKGAGYRVTMDESSDPISGKIKSAQLKQIPWMLVLGAKEMENGTVTLRHRDGKQEFGLTLQQIMAKAHDLN